MERVGSIIARTGEERRQAEGTAADRDRDSTMCNVALRRDDAVASLDGMAQLRGMLKMFGQESMLPEGFARVQFALRQAIDDAAPLPILTEGGHE